MLVQGGRKLLGILPDLETIQNNGENILILGKFNEDLLSILNQPNNEYYKNDIRPYICNDCEIKQECDGRCRLDLKNPEMLKENCNALKKLFEYVKELK